MPRDRQFAVVAPRLTASRRRLCHPTINRAIQPSHAVAYGLPLNETRFPRAESPAIDQQIVIPRKWARQMDGALPLNVNQSQNQNSRFTHVLGVGCHRFYFMIRAVPETRIELPFSFEISALIFEGMPMSSPCTMLMTPLCDQPMSRK